MIRENRAPYVGISKDKNDYAKSHQKWQNYAAYYLLLGSVDVSGCNTTWDGLDHNNMNTQEEIEMSLLRALHSDLGGCFFDIQESC